ncbi:hypothetical protein B0H14DRAFT_3876460 [Mycena olivaceomarginata]|nr:hypothetical protein B0H14DRAFT_3876460 [Mycena olivaceomarginata]
MPSYVITGASRGLAQIRQAAKRRQVFAVVRNKTNATNLHALSKNNVTILEANVTDPKALKLAAVEVSKATGNKLDYLINNAGSSTNPGFTLDQFPSTEAVENDLLDNFKTNTISVVHSTNAFLPLLKNGSTKKAKPRQPSYSIAKAALNMVVAKYAAQFKSEGFFFLAMSPGIVDVSGTKESGPTAGALEEFKMLTKAVAKAAPDFKGPIMLEDSKPTRSWTRTNTSRVTTCTACWDAGVDTHSVVAEIRSSGTGS